MYEQGWPDDISALITETHSCPHYDEDIVSDLKKKKKKQKGRLIPGG